MPEPCFLTAPQRCCGMFPPASVICIHLSARIYRMDLSSCGLRSQREPCRTCLCSPQLGRGPLCTCVCQVHSRHETRDMQSEPVAPRCGLYSLLPPPLPSVLSFKAAEVNIALQLFITAADVVERTVLVCLARACQSLRSHLISGLFESPRNTHSSMTACVPRADRALAFCDPAAA